MNKGIGYSQSFALQQLIFKDAVAASDPLVRAKLAQVWDLLEDRRRIIRGRGLPKAEDRSDKFKKRNRNPIAGTIGEEPQTSNVPPSQPSIETVSQLSIETVSQSQIEIVSIKEIPLNSEPVTTE